MNRLTWQLLLYNVVILAACADKSAPATEPDQLAAKLIAAEARLDSSFMSGEREFREISAEVPAFGGYYIDDTGSLVVLVSDAAQAEAAEQAVLKVLEKADAGISGAASLRHSRRTVKYSFRQLSTLRDRANWPLFATRGVISVDLDEVANQLSIGVTDRAAETRAREVLAALAAPSDAVTFWHGRIEADVGATPAAAAMAPGDSLTSRNRPVKGGMEIRYLRNDSIFACTMMLGVKYGSPQVAGLMTNAHCTRTINSITPATVYYNNQAYTASDSNRIAHETVEPLFTNCGSNGDKCRPSDAAFAVWDSANAASFGKIARPTSQGAFNNSSGVGPLTIDPVNPEFSVTSEAGNPSVGTAVYKVGAVTGWTGGPVVKTCVNTTIATINPPPSFFPTYIATCQTGARYGRHRGDSGGPIFRYSGTGDVSLQGIHVSVTYYISPVRDTLANFSRITQIRSDFPTGFSTY